MKNLPPSGYQGFPSLFSGLFGGVAILFRRFVRRRASDNQAEQLREQEKTELKPIRGSWEESGSRAGKKPGAGG